MALSQWLNVYSDTLTLKNALLGALMAGKVRQLCDMRHAVAASPEATVLQRLCLPPQQKEHDWWRGEMAGIGWYLEALAGIWWCGWICEVRPPRAGFGLARSLHRSTRS